jgi:hypothetical protein
MRRAVAGTSEGGKGKGGERGRDASNGRRDGDDGRGGGSAKMQREHHDTTSNQAFEAAPQNTTIKL